MMVQPTNKNTNPIRLHRIRPFANFKVTLSPVVRIYFPGFPGTYAGFFISFVYNSFISESKSTFV